MTTVTISSLAATLEKYAALLQPKSITAIVLAAIDPTTFQLQVKDGTVVVKSDVPLTVGASVELALDANGQPSPNLVAKAAEQLRTLQQTAAATSVIVDRSVQTAPDSSEASAAKALIETAATVLRGNAAQQGGLAPLFADVESLLAQPALALPPAVANAARQLLGFRVDTRGSESVDAAELKDAIIKSELPAGVVTATVKPGGLTAALLLLRQELKKWADQSQTQLPESLPETTSPESSRLLRAPNLTPPYRNSPTVGQAPLAPSLAGDEPPHVLAAHLLSETQAALARQTLLRIASLPEAETSDGSSPDADKTSRTVDIPLILPQGPAVAQIRIEQDRSAAKNRSSQAQPRWKASFSIDVESIGPVHVQIALMGDRTSVKMNAERPETASLLSSGLPELAARLRDVQLDPADLHCETVARKPGPAAPGLFTDVST